MRKNEKMAVVRLVRYMQQLQCKLKEPSSADDVTDEEVLDILSVLWQWTPNATHQMPNKHMLECFVGLFRGFHERTYCYMRGEDVARIVKEEYAKHSTQKKLPNIRFDVHPDSMSLTELYEFGKWNYKPTPLADLLWDMYCNGLYTEWAPRTTLEKEEGK